MSKLCVIENLEFKLSVMHNLAKELLVKRYLRGYSSYCNSCNENSSHASMKNELNFNLCNYANIKDKLTYMF